MTKPTPIGSIGSIDSRRVSLDSRHTLPTRNALASLMAELVQQIRRECSNDGPTASATTPDKRTSRAQHELDNAMAAYDQGRFVEELDRAGNVVLADFEADSALGVPPEVLAHHYDVRLGTAGWVRLQAAAREAELLDDTGAWVHFGLQLLFTLRYGMDVSGGQRQLVRAASPDAFEAALRRTAADYGCALPDYYARGTGNRRSFAAGPPAGPLASLYHQVRTE